MRSPHTPGQNHLLEAFPTDEFGRIEPHLEPVAMPLGRVLFESGGPQRHAYFPTTAIVSVLHVLANGASAEIAMVGNEGMIGMSLCMGGDTTTNRAVVQSAGHGYRLPAASLKQEFNRGGGGVVMRLLLRHTQALITQMSQTAVCNRHHTLEQQLCRWLLLNLDRLATNELAVTQEFISNMLGVRREGITAAAGNLQSAGLIRYGRGHITVLDRPRLEARVCECYAVVKRETDRLLPHKAEHPDVGGTRHVPQWRGKHQDGIEVAYA
jgi:CRP-like cAMP-binding protein